MKNITILFLSLSLLLTIVGCEAFVRKFTRKPNQENIPQEEMVLVPEEYKGPSMSKEELYRQYFLFWKSWQEELIESLLQRRSQKKQLACMEEAMNNLLNLRALLNQAAQNKLDIDLNQLKDLKDRIKKDLYGNDVADNAVNAERIKLNIIHGFSYAKIKDSLL